MALRKGYDPNRAKGGKRANAGRKPDWLKEQTRNIIDREKLIDRLALIASGKDIPQPIANGEVIPIPAPVSEQRKAILDLIERGYGKVTQPVSGDDGGPIVIKVVNYSRDNDPA